jgi:hypothetical protein
LTAGQFLLPAKEIRESKRLWPSGCARQMYRHRLLPLLRNGLAEKQRVGLRFKADTAPKPQKADFQSIIPTLRELLPVLPKRESDDANPNSHAPRRKRRGPLFYIALSARSTEAIDNSG